MKLPIETTIVIDMKAGREVVNILHVEDEPQFRALVGFALVDCGVNYDLDSVTTREAAIEIIDEIASGEHKPYDIFILDGDLSPESHDGADAKLISDHISELGLTAKIIGLSSEPLNPYDVSVDEDLGKENVAELSQVVESFVRPHPNNLSA